MPTGNEARIRWRASTLERRFGWRPRVSRGAVSEKAGSTQCPTCCAQHARREWREDCAGSGDSDEDEGAEALAGFFRLVVEMWGVFCGRISREASGGAETAQRERIVLTQTLTLTLTLTL